MFFFPIPFGSREHDTTLPKNCSGKNLDKFTNKCQLLCLSEPNIPETSESRKWERWRANSKMGYQMDVLLKNKSGKKQTAGNYNNNTNGNKDKVVAQDNDCSLHDILPENSSPVQVEVSILHAKQKFATEENNKTSVLSALNTSQTNDIEFIDESNGLISVIQEANKEKQDCFNIDAPSSGLVSPGTKNIKSETSVCLKNKKSIICQKSVTNSVRTVDVPQDLQIKYLVSNESLHTVSLANTQAISHAKSYLSMPQKSNLSNANIISLESDSDLQKTSNKNIRHQQKINSGLSFLSFCSLFNISKSYNENAEKIYFRNNEINQRDDASLKFQHNITTANLTCCPLSEQQGNNQCFPKADTKKSELVIINKSPKSENKILFPGVPQMFNSEAFEYQNSSLNSSHSSFGQISWEGTAPLASPEAISSMESIFSTSKLSGHSVSEVSLVSGSNLKDFFCGSHSSPLSARHTSPQAKFKLLHEGDVKVCYINHARTIISKVLSSKFLRKWETHHLYLTNDCICSKTPIGFLESAVPYSNIDEIYVLGRWDQGNRFCLRLMMTEGSLLLQASNSIERDQWFSSILWKKNMHKYRNILQTSKRPEVIVKEIKGLIYSSLNSSLRDDCIRNVPIEIISRVLDEDEVWNDRQRTEEIIVALAPLLEDSTPSSEMFHFFSRLCLCHPRSPVVLDIFTGIVHRILKRTVDFGKAPLMRRFVADYLKALHLQNDGDEAIRKFVASIHGPSCVCPHPRVLPNLVAVNLAAVFSHFEQKKTFLTESVNETNSSQAGQLLDKQLECFITLFIAISEFEDWRPGLAQLLQPIPFPDDALSHEAFIKSLIPVINKIGTDPRCEVHEMVLGIRENKEGWLNVFCPSSLVCKDEGVLWCQMLKTLFSCCCKRKSFLQKMIKHLGSLLLVALRNHTVAQEILCLMLEWRLIPGEDQEMQVVTTLQSTQSGRNKYNELCKKQEHIKELQKKGGPKKLTLPNRSMDADVARLLSCGSFGNLECLSLAFTHVTSACSHQLIQLPALRYLNLWATQFGDAGLIVIAEHLDKLEVLNLCETPVSDKGIIAIVAMKSLKKLNLNSTKLSPQTLKVLTQKLPTLQELDVRYTDAW